MKMRMCLVALVATLSPLTAQDLAVKARIVHTAE